MSHWSFQVCFLDRVNKVRQGQLVQIVLKSGQSRKTSSQYCYNVIIFQTCWHHGYTMYPKSYQTCVVSDKYSMNTGKNTSLINNHKKFSLPLGTSTFQNNLPKPWNHLPGASKKPLFRPLMMKILWDKGVFRKEGGIKCGLWHNIWLSPNLLS